MWCVPIPFSFRGDCIAFKNDVEDRLARLPQLDKAELIKLWRKFFGREPSPAIRKGLMVRVIGHRLLEEAFGGLSATGLRRLRELAKTFEADANANVSSRPSIKPGTRLIRQWPIGLTAVRTGALQSGKTRNSNGYGRQE